MKSHLPYSSTCITGPESEFNSSWSLLHKRGCICITFLKNLSLLQWHLSLADLISRVEPTNLANVSTVSDWLFNVSSWVVLKGKSCEMGLKCALDGHIHEIVVKGSHKKLHVAGKKPVSSPVDDPCRIHWNKERALFLYFSPSIISIIRKYVPLFA